MKTSKTIIFIVITLVMLNNVEHLGMVHYDLARKLFPIIGAGDWLNKAHSIVVVIIFEIVVVTFAILGKKGFSLFFTFCIWIISMIYYDAPDLFMQQRWEDLIAATVYSSIFTISIYMFSEMLAEWYQDDSMVKILRARINELQSTVKDLQSKCSTWEASALDTEAKLKEAEGTIAVLSGKHAALQRELTTYQRAEEKAREALRCPHCRDFIADTEGQLRSHKGHCPENPNSSTKTKAA